MTDTQAGIRTIREIRNLPVKDLTDEEIVKLFFERFKANVAAFVYQDKEGKTYCFGRLRKNKKARKMMTYLFELFHFRFGVAENWKTID